MTSTPPTAVLKGNVDFNPPDHAARLIVLGSGSRGNTSLLHVNVDLGSL